MRVTSVIADLDAVLARLAMLAPAAAGADALLAAAVCLESGVTSLQVAQARVLAAMDVREPSHRGDQGPVTVQDLSRTTAHEVSAVLQCSLTSARERIDLAEQACMLLPGLLGQAAVGRIRWWQVRRATDEITCAGLDRAGAALVDGQLVDDVLAGRATSGFMRRLRRHVLAADPAFAEAEHENAVARRKVVIRRSAHGMSWLGADLPAEQARAVGRCLDELANTVISRPYPAGGRCPDPWFCPSGGQPPQRRDRTGPSARSGPGEPDPDQGPTDQGYADQRCADQRRADALSGLAHLVLDALREATAAGTDPQAVIAASVVQAARSDSGASRGASRTAGGDPRRFPGRRTRRPGQAGQDGDRGGVGPTPRTVRIRPRGEVSITVSAETLLGLSTAPAEMAGGGPITAAHARRIANSAGVVWRRLLTDPVSGTLLDRCRTTYRPPADLADLVRARHGGMCSRPYCTHRARDLDHARPWFDPDGGPGGPTSAANLHAVCRGCHTAKHDGWTVELSPDGAATWTTPHRWSATTPAPDLRPEDHLPHPGPPGRRGQADHCGCGAAPAEGDASVRPPVEVDEIPAPF